MDRIRSSWIAVAALVGLGATPGVRADEPPRSAYSYVRDATGQVTVVSDLNGSVEARANLPISVGDEIRTEDPARAEIALADGNLLDIGGGTRVRLASLYAQQGSSDEVSAIDLEDGSIVPFPGSTPMTRPSTRIPAVAFASTQTPGGAR
jgi:hypothetical protein